MLVWMVGAGLLSSCAQATLSQAPPCLVQPGASAIQLATPRLDLAPNQSQPFCSNDVVLRHYEEADAWFIAQTDQRRYAPNVIEGLAEFYMEPLLHATREMIIHHQREGRVAVATWSERSRTGIFWSEDGREVTLRFEVRGYELLLYTAAEAEPERFRGPINLEHWLITLRYHPEDERWKIVATRVEQIRV